ncbi:hypothetical protein GCM10022235_81920 [Kribbella ginsengisoli]
MAFSSTEVLARQLEILADRGARGVTPRLSNQTLPNAAASLLSVRFGLRGPLVTVSGELMARIARVREERNEPRVVEAIESLAAAAAQSRASRLEPRRSDLRGANSRIRPQHPHRRCRQSPVHTQP